MTARDTQSSASTLVAIIVAARRAYDRELERQARRQLQEQHGMKLSFLSGKRKGVEHA